MTFSCGGRHAAWDRGAWPAGGKLRRPIKLLLIRSQEAFTVEMDEVGGRVRHPDFCFPGDLSHIAGHNCPIREGRHIHQTRLSAGKECCKLVMAFAVHRTVTGYGFHQQEPVFFGIVEDHIRHLAVGIDHHAQAGKQAFVKIAPFVASIPHIEQNAAGHEAGSERSHAFFHRKDSASWAHHIHQ